MSSDIGLDQLIPSQLKHFFIKILQLSNWLKKVLAKNANRNYYHLH